MDSLKLLKQRGYIPDIIIDIGAFKGFWTDQVRKIYPSSDYYLFEAINYPELDRFKQDKKVSVFKNVLLFDEEKTVNWYEEKNTGDSIFKENTVHFENTVPIKRNTITLSKLTKNEGILQNIENKNVFVKIDTQGSELNILKGGLDIFSHTDYIILELPFFGVYNKGAPTFLEYIQFMDSIDFIPYDIVEKHVSDGIMFQLDIIFISRNFVRKNYKGKIFDDIA